MTLSGYLYFHQKSKVEKRAIRVTGISWSLLPFLGKNMVCLIKRQYSMVIKRTEFLSSTYELYILGQVI
jgi:hypothetical protein